MSARPRPPASARPRPAVDDRPPKVCGHGNPRCGDIPARPYPCGWRCEEHQPARTRPYYAAP